MVLTSLRGPDQPLHLAGVPLRDLAFWVPRAGHLGLGLSLLRYAGRVRLGVAADAGLVPDPERLAEAFTDELARLENGAEVP